MAYTETIICEHPHTSEEVELTVKFTYAPEERATLDDPGAPEEWDILSVEDQCGNYYPDELVWEDSEIIEGLKQC